MISGSKFVCGFSFKSRLFSAYDIFIKGINAGKDNIINFFKNLPPPGYVLFDITIR